MKVSDPSLEAIIDTNNIEVIFDYWYTARNAYYDALACERAVAREGGSAKFTADEWLELNAIVVPILQKNGYDDIVVIKEESVQFAPLASVPGRRFVQWILNWFRN